MKMLMTLILGLILLPTMAVAAIIHVPVDQPTIQAGINASVAGDTVLVASGTYSENIRFYGKAVLLTSISGRAATFIQAADQSTPIVRFIDSEDSTSVIRGFAIRNVSNSYGIYCLSSYPIIEECEVSNCSKLYADGAGIWCVFSAPKIRNNVIHDNSFGNTGGGVGGGADHGTRYWEITHNVIYNNYSPHGSGIGCPGGQYILIAYNLIHDNTSYAEQGAGIYVNGHHLMIRNNTIVGNQRGIRLLNGSNTDIRNNIVVSNLMEGLTPQNATFDYNNIFSNGSQNLLSTHGLSLDPLFADTLTDNFHLSGASPCRNAGDPSSLYDDPDGSRNDMGALYYANTAPTAPALTGPPNTTIVPMATLRPQFVWTASTDPDPLDTVTYLLAIALDSNFAFVQHFPGLTDTGYTMTTDLQWGKQYWWNVKASDKHDDEIWSPQVFTFRTMTLGDADNDGIVTVADIVFLINYIFMGGGAPQPLMAGNSNCDGSINIADAVFLIKYVFAHGPAPCSAF
jgi:parallel beta-helix repeat protein